MIDLVVFSSQVGYSRTTITTKEKSHLAFRLQAPKQMGFLKTFAPHSPVERLLSVINIAQKSRMYNAPLSSVPYSDALKKPYKFIASVHADMLTVKRVNYIPYKPQSPNTNTRGIVKTFSRKSRKRIITKLACWRVRSPVLFLTLTYPDIFPQTFEEQKADFEAFRMCLKRAYPDAVGIWRYELKTRKSGINKGKIAPHWHLILEFPSALKFGLSESENQVFLNQFTQRLSEKLRDDWHRIAGGGDQFHIEHGFDVSQVRSRRHANSYVSKYIAKCDDIESEAGRRWGVIGVLDTSQSIEVSLTLDEYVNLRRFIRQLLRKKKSKFSRKFGKMSHRVGMSAFGFGDTKDFGKPNPTDCTIIWLILHAVEVSKSP